MGQPRLYKRIAQPRLFEVVVVRAAADASASLSSTSTLSATAEVLRIGAATSESLVTAEASAALSLVAAAAASSSSSAAAVPRRVRAAAASASSSSTGAATASVLRIAAAAAVSTSAGSATAADGGSSASAVSTSTGSATAQVTRPAAAAGISAIMSAATAEVLRLAAAASASVSSGSATAADQEFGNLWPGYSAFSIDFAEYDLNTRLGGREGLHGTVPLDCGTTAKITPPTLPQGVLTPVTVSTEAELEAACAAGSRDITLDDDMDTVVLLTSSRQTIADVLIRLNGHKINSLVLAANNSSGGDWTLDRLLVTGPGLVGSVLTGAGVSSGTVTISDVYYRGLWGAPDFKDVPEGVSVFTGGTATVVVNRMALVSCVVRGYTGVAGTTCGWIGGGTDVAAVGCNIAGGPNAVLPEDNWGWRSSSLGASPTRHWMVDTVLQGNTKPAYRQSGTSTGMVHWSTPSARGTNRMITLRNRNSGGMEHSNAHSPDTNGVFRLSFIWLMAQEQTVTTLLWGPTPSDANALYVIADGDFRATSSDLFSASTLATREGQADPGEIWVFSDDDHTFQYADPIDSIDPGWPTVSAEELVGPGGNFTLPAIPFVGADPFDAPPFMASSASATSTSAGSATASVVRLGEAAAQSQTVAAAGGEVLRGASASATSTSVGSAAAVVVRSAAAAATSTSSASASSAALRGAAASATSTSTGSATATVARTAAGAATSTSTGAASAEVLRTASASATSVSVGSATADEGLIDLAAELGADLLHWWEVPESSSELITLNGSNVAQLDDRVGSAHAVQATELEQPAFNATGGPGGTPCIEFPTQALRLAATISLAAGHRVGLYALISHPSTTSNRRPVAVLSDTSTFVMAPRSASGAWNADIWWNFAPGGNETIVITTPAKDESYHLWAFRPLATGTLLDIDGVEPDPTFTPNTDGLLNAASLTIGAHTNASGGQFVFAILVDDPTDAKDAIIRAYIEQRYGLDVTP